MLQNNSNYHILGYSYPISSLHSMLILFSGWFRTTRLYLLKVWVSAREVSPASILWVGGPVYVWGWSSAGQRGEVRGEAPAREEGGRSHTTVRGSPLACRATGGESVMPSPNQFCEFSWQRNAPLTLFFTSFSNLSNMDETFLSQRIDSFTFIIWFHGEQACYKWYIEWLS